MVITCVAVQQVLLKMEFVGSYQIIWPEPIYTHLLMHPQRQKNIYLRMMLIVPFLVVPFPYTLLYLNSLSVPVSSLPVIRKHSCAGKCVQRSCKLGVTAVCL